MRKFVLALAILAMGGGIIAARAQVRPAPESFSVFVANSPVATTPFAASDVVPVIQNGMVHHTSPTSLTALGLTVGTTTITSGTDKGLIYDNAGVLGNLATANSGVLVTSGIGVPSISSTLPSGMAATNMALTTPTATSINKVAITAPVTGATLTIADGRTLTDTSVVGGVALKGAPGGGFAQAACANLSDSAAGCTATTMTATIGGLVPTPPNNSTTFLRGDGTFAAPVGSGTVTVVGAGNLTLNAPVIGGGAQSLSTVAAMTDGQLLVGATGGAPAPTTLSKDCTLSSLGAITCLKTNNVALGTMATQAASAVAITGGTLTGLTGLAIRDTSAAFDVTLAGTSSTTLNAGRTLTLDMKNVAHILAFNATANTITFPNTANYTLVGSGDSGTVTNTMLAGSIDLTAKVTGVLPAANGGTSVASLPIPPTGRLTLTTGTPVMIAGVSGATTIYYTPYQGSTVPFYDGTEFYLKVCAEISNITTNSAVGNAGPAAVGASSNYDLFVWDNAGFCTLTRAAAWTNNTTRANTLTRQNGILLNTSSITNGPAALRGTYVGSVSSNGSSTIDWILGAAASGGTAGSYQVWNAYNRVLTGCVVTDSGATYTYTTATIRQARASAGNQCSFMLGLQEDTVPVSINEVVTMVPAVGAFTRFAPGADSTSTFACPAAFVESGAATTLSGSAMPGCLLAPGIGNHVISANELGDGTNANTFDALSTSQLSVMVRN